jgi:hypothetical protein
MRCEHKNVDHRWVEFKNGTHHIAKRCNDCQKHLGFAPRRDFLDKDLPAGNTSRQERIALGMPVGCRACGDEGSVGISGVCPACRKKGKHKTLRRYSKEIGVGVFDMSKEQLFELWGSRA